MKAEELRGLPADLLVQRLDEARQELFNLRINRATGQLDNHRELRRSRKDVARMMTLHREHELTQWLAALEEHLGRSLQEPQPLELMDSDRSAAPEEVES